MACSSRMKAAVEHERSSSVGLLQQTLLHSFPKDLGSPARSIRLCTVVLKNFLSEGGIQPLR